MARRGLAIGLVVGLLFAVLVAARLAGDDGRGVVDLRGDPATGAIAGPRQPSGTTPRCSNPAGVTRTCVIVEEAFTRPLMVGGVLVATGGSTVHGMDPDTLTVVWTAGSSYSDDARVTPGGGVVVEDNTDVVVLDAATGRTRWSAPRPDTLWAEPTSPLVLLVSGLSLSAREADDGEVRWTADVRRGDLVAVVGDDVFVTDDDPDTDDVVLSVEVGDVRDVRIIDAEELEPTSPTNPLVRQDGVAVTITPPEAASWSVPTLVEHPFVTVHDDDVLIAWDDRVDVHDLSTGDLRWTFLALAPAVIHTDPLLIAGNGLVYLMADDLLDDS